jgi:hypothetical protein
MKRYFLPCLVIALSLLSHPVFSQAKSDTASLGLAGDNLDLYAVMDLFLKSKTIEAFEKTLNEQKTGINNLDLDLDKKVDFIKVVTKKDSESYTFILQIAVSKTETQDVAVILVNRDKNKKVNVQIVGDEDLYGKDYVIEPKPSGSPAVTANPAYVGPDPVVKDVPATTTVVVQSAPIVQYVYSPAYVPYYPPYYYGFYPPYFAAFTVMAVGIYRHNNWYHHGGYYGGHYHGGGNTVVINNRNQINHYNNTRNSSNRVQHNNASGNYGNGNRGGANRPSTGGPSASTRPSNGGPSASTRPSNGGPSASTRPSNGGPSASTRPSNGGPSASTRQSGSGFSSSEGRTRSSGGGSYGGGGSRGGGGGFGGGGRGGGGGGRRR